MTDEQPRTNTFVIRDIPRDVSTRVDIIARTVGKSREQWLRDIISDQASTNQYTIKVRGRPRSGELHLRNGIVESASYGHWSTYETEVFNKAKALLASKDPTDHNQAMLLLAEAFDEILVNGSPQPEKDDFPVRYRYQHNERAHWYCANCAIHFVVHGELSPDVLEEVRGSEHLCERCQLEGVQP